MPYKEQSPFTRAMHGMASFGAQALPQIGLDQARRKYESEEYEKRKKMDWDYMTKKMKLDRENKERENLYKLAMDPKALPRMREPAMELYQKEDPMSPEHKHLWNQIYNSIRLSKPAPEKPTKFTFSDLKLNIAMDYLKDPNSLTEERERILFAPTLQEQFYQFQMGGGISGRRQSGGKKPLEEIFPK